MKFAKYLTKKADEFQDDPLTHGSVMAYRNQGGPFSNKYESLRNDPKIVEYIRKRFLPSEKHRKRDHIFTTAASGLGGASAGAALGMIPEMFRETPTGKGAIIGGLAGAGLGGLLGHLHYKKIRAQHDKLSDDEKRELIKHYLHKINEQQNTRMGRLGTDIERGYNLNSIAGLISGITVPAAGMAMVGANAHLPELQNSHLQQMLDVSNLDHNTAVVIPSKPKAPFFSENAYFQGLENPTSDGITGQVQATSKRMWKPGVIAHELGHADIHNNGGLVDYLQRNVYGPTLEANSLGLGMIPTFASYAATKNEDDPTKGALKGGLIGSVANAGVLIPEFEASRRGIKHLFKTNLPLQQKILNSATLTPAFLSYLMSLAGPSAIVGGLHAYKNRKKKGKKKKE